jgi:membrane protein YdbS with pleckstrin-like domain
VSAWAYAERPQELLFRSGRVLRTMTVVPYGRLQFVDIEAGPLARSFGLASVQLHTASAHTNARIPGLAAAEAARLRDRLTERGEAQLAGL